MAFIIDTLGWDFNNLELSNISLRLETILDRLEIATQRNEKFYFSNELQSRPVYRDMDLWSFLYSDATQDLDNSIITELASYLNGGMYYEDQENIWPEGFPDNNVQDVNGEFVSLDYAFVHFKNLSGSPFACITPVANAPKELISENEHTTLTFISNDQEHKDFWRKNALFTMRDTQINLKFLSPHAYPNLYFHENVWNGVDDFLGGYAAVYGKLQKYLATLDDYAYWIFTTPPPALHMEDNIVYQANQTPSNDLIQRRFQAVGLIFSPEKPDVKNNAKCRKAREIKIDKSTFYCEWHGKLELYKNRIHIYPPVAESNQKVIIAIFHEHLPLP